MPSTGRPPTEDGFEVIADARPEDGPWPAMTWPPTASRLVGQVVELTPCDPDMDASGLFEALEDDAVWRHLIRRPQDAEQLRALLARQQAEGRFVWVVRLRGTSGSWQGGVIVGMSSYLDVSVADARLEIGATAYAPRVWGTKVNTDAKLQLLTHAFETLGVGRVQLKTDVRNVRSQRAIAHLGAHFEGTLRRFQRRHDGTIRDTVLFSIVAEEWPAVRERLGARLRS